MTLRWLLLVMFWGALLGLLIAIFNGQDRLISLQLWIAVFTSYLALRMLMRLFGSLPLEASVLTGLWPMPRRSKAPDVDQRLPDLRATESLVLRARDNARVHNQQLRPRLTAIAAHYLPTYHGIEPVRQPDRAAEVLGELHWLIDPTITDRSPTTHELQRFMARVTRDHLPGEDLL